MECRSIFKCVANELHDQFTLRDLSFDFFWCIKYVFLAREPPHFAHDTINVHPFDVTWYGRPGREIDYISI